MKSVLIVQGIVPHYRKPVFNSLAERYAVTVLHSGPESVLAEDQFHEILTPVTRLGPFYWQHGVLQHVREDKYDVIILMCDVRWLANVAAVLSKSSGRILYWGHRYSRYGVINVVRESVIKRADGVVQYSDAETDQLIRHGIPASQIYLAPNTLYIPNHEDTSHDSRSSFLFVGRAQKRKRVDELIRAFASVQRELPPQATVDVVGAGQENEKLKQLARDLDLQQRVRFHGKITDPDRLRDLFRQAYAYVSPGPVGLGVVHSLAYGVPVVTRSEGKHGPEFRYLTHARNALIYQEPRELGEILRRLCQEDQLATQLGTQAYSDFRRKASFEGMVGGLINAIEGTQDGADTSRSAAA